MTTANAKAKAKEPKAPKRRDVVRREFGARERRRPARRTQGTR